VIYKRREIFKVVRFQRKHTHTHTHTYTHIHIHIHIHTHEMIESAEIILSITQVQIEGVGR
jgi:hypothetical protein